MGSVCQVGWHPALRSRARDRRNSQMELDDAVTSIDLDELAFHLGKRAIESDDAVSHGLLHLKPRGEIFEGFSKPEDRASYLLARTELGSKYISGMVYDAMQKRHSKRLTELLADPNPNSSIVKLYGDLYEPNALKKLLAGGTFDAFDFSTGKYIEGGVDVAPSTRRYFSGCDGLRTEIIGQECQGPFFYVPRSGTFTAVDAILPGRKLVNFTINLDHSLILLGKRNTEGVFPVADALGIIGLTDIAFYGRCPAIVMTRPVSAARLSPWHRLFRS